MMKFSTETCIFILSGLLLLAGCDSKPTKVVQEATIAGKIQIPVTEKIYFYSYADSIDFYMAHQSPVDSAVVDENGTFSFNLKINQPTVFSLQHGKNNLVNNLLIGKGDQLEITFHGKENRPRITPFGEAAKFNTYLLQFLDSFYNATEIKNEYYIASNYMDVNQFAVYNDKRKEKMMAFVASYFKNDSLRSDFSDYALQTIKYEIASDRLMYLWKKRMKGEPAKPDTSFFNFATSEFINNDIAFITPSYIRFLNLYIRDIYDRMVENGEITTGESGKLIPAVEKYKLAIEKLNGKSRDAVLFNILLTDMDDVSEEHIISNTPAHNLDSLLNVFKTKYRLE